MKKFTTILSILILCASMLMLSGRVFWVFDLFRNYLVQFACVAMFSILLLCIQRRFILATATALLAGYMVWPLHTMIPYIHAATTDGAVFTVLSANVNFQNESYGLLTEQILKEQPDMIFLQETDRSWIDAVKNATGNLYPYEIEALSHTYRGMAVLSRFPFTHVERIEMSEEESPIIRATIPEFDIQIIGAHTLSPVSSVWSAKRDEMLMFLGGLSSAGTGKLLVIGDLNSTIHTTAFQGMLEVSGLHDARRGFGWKPSWMYGTPFAAAIDHVLYEGDLTVNDFNILDDIGSDHRPIMASFSIHNLSS